MSEPIPLRNEEAGYVEFANEDVPYFVREIDGSVAILFDAKSRNVIGYRVYDRAPSPSPAPGVVETIAAVLLGNVNAPEQEIYRVALEIAVLASLSQPAKGEREGGEL